MEQNLENKIYIPEEFENTIFDSLPLTKGLLAFLRKNRICFLKDLRHINSETVKLIVKSSEKPFPELRRFLTVIQKSRPDLVILELKVIGKLTLSGFMSFINTFLEQIPLSDKEILLERFGGWNDEKVLEYKEIAKKNKITKEQVASRLNKLIVGIKNGIGESAEQLTNKLKTDCEESVCPLTAKFLVYLTDNNYNLFLYPPTFYIRIIEKLLPEIPVFIETENKTKIMEVDVTKVVKEIEEFLNMALTPLSLKEIFSENFFLYSVTNNAEKTFFEAIKSPKFNLIQGDKPNELFIELRESTSQ